MKSVVVCNTRYRLATKEFYTILSTTINGISALVCKYYDYSYGFVVSNLKKITDASLSIGYYIFDKFLYDYIPRTSTRDRIVKLFLGAPYSIPMAYMSICKDKRLVPIVKWALCNLIETAKRKDKKLVPIYKNLLQEIEKQTKL